MEYAVSGTQIASSGVIVDSGCGNGALLCSFSTVAPNWILAGSEIDDRHRHEIESISDDAIFYTCPVKDLPGNFDIISMVHVLEHIINPIQFLCDVRNKLSDSGFIIIGVPDHKQNPFDLLIADHCTHFSDKSLMNIVHKSGLEIVGATSRWVPKEQLLIVKKSEYVDNVNGSEDRAQGDIRMVRDLVDCHVAWLGNISNMAKELSCSGDFGIFGTSIAGTWLYATAGRAGFFVDEDLNRAGKLYLGRPVYRPSDIPGNSTVFIVQPPGVALGICERLSGHRTDVQFIIPMEM